MRRVLHWSLSLLALAPARALAQRPVATQEQAPMLRVDPRLIAEAAEVWAVIAGPKNPVWPGWDASTTPILFYLPGEQDVLINHPHPPPGFAPYAGPVRFPGGAIAVGGPPTIIAADGQNTSRDIEGVRTLVVADALSNLRQDVRSLLADPRPNPEKAESLEYSQLATDPYHQLMLIAHEAFHVFQRRVAPAKGANEMLLTRYPVLSVENNVGFAQEGAALAAALRADSGPAFSAAVLQWFALRQQRRSRLPAAAVEYEDGVEFNEGLAKYAEYGLLEALPGRRPSPEMWWIEGFHGYGDLAPLRAALVDQMLRHMRGDVAVNNDPYGTAPLRLRLYFSGMAVAVVLDRLSPTWKTRVIEPRTSLTSLVAEALAPRPDDLPRAVEAARREPDYEALVAAKTRLAEAGRARIDSVLAQIERGEGTGIIVEYGALATPRVGFAFTPFGITVVDSSRTIYAQVPIVARFPDGSEVAQTAVAPLLHDANAKIIRFRLPRELSGEEMSRALNRGGAASIELPGVRVSAPSASIRQEGRDLRIVLSKEVLRSR